MLGGCCPSARWMVLVGPRFSSLCGLLAVLGFADATARCCGGGGAKLLGRAAQFLRGAEMCDDRMKILHGFCRAGGDGTRGCRFPSWRRRRGVFGISLARLEFVVVSRRKPRFDRIDMMAASSTSLLCWKHHVWRHGLVSRCFPPVFAVVLF